MDTYATALDARVDTAKFVTFNTNRITGIGNEPVISGSAPYVAEKQLTGPLAGKNGVYVYSVYNKSQSDAPYNAAAEKQTLENNLTYRLMYQSMDVLKNHAQIEDFRINFY